MLIRPYQPNDTNTLVDLFYAAVHHIDDHFYTPAQRAAWAPEPIDYQQWGKRFATTQPYVGVQDNVITGFIEIAESGYIDCLYVHHEWQQKGVGGALLRFAIDLAERQHLPVLTVDASLVAKPLFHRYGFKVVTENTVHRHQQKLINYRMQLILTGKR